MLMVIDVGNTHAKWKAWVEGEPYMRGRFETGDDADSFIRWLAKQKVERIVLAEVGAGSILSRLHEAVAPGKIRQIHSQKSLLGVTNCYAEPERLGVDRLLGAVEARHLSAGKPVCVLDVGTAATLDIVDEQGMHRGGYIVPGLEMLREMLQLATERVRYERNDSLQLGYGQSTAEAVEHGTWGMLLAWLQCEIRRFQQAYPQGQIYLTGGLMRPLSEHLPESVICHQDLVLDALMRVALA